MSYSIDDKWQIFCEEFSFYNENSSVVTDNLEDLLITNWLRV